MFYQVKGDILLSKACAIVQGVEINDPMDKGLALALRNQYPECAKISIAGAINTTHDRGKPGSG